MRLCPGFDLETSPCQARDKVALAADVGPDTIADEISSGPGAATPNSCGIFRGLTRPCPKGPTRLAGQGLP